MQNSPYAVPAQTALDADTFPLEQMVCSMSEGVPEDEYGDVLEADAYAALMSSADYTHMYDDADSKAQWEFSAKWPLTVLPKLPNGDVWVVVSLGIGHYAIDTITGKYTEDQAEAFTPLGPEYVLAHTAVPGCIADTGGEPHLSLYRSAHPDFVYLVNRVADEWDIVTWYKRRASAD